jgi:hypothetical protein
MTRILVIRSQRVNLDLNDHALQQSQCTKFVELSIAANLSWDEHISCLLKEFSAPPAS